MRTINVKMGKPRHKGGRDRFQQRPKPPKSAEAQANYDKYCTK